MASKQLTEIPGGYRLPESLSFDIVPSRGGEPYRIFISQPAGDAPPGGWPVLYLTDGNACFPIAAAAHAIQSPYPKGTNVDSGIVVAIGYPGDAPFDLRRRAWDLTPPPGRTYPPYSKGDAEVVTGGADAFLAFIETELKPAVAARLPINHAGQALFGHSFGGLFTLYALFRNPAAFTRYIAASPSIFWEECRLLSFERGFSFSADCGKRFLHLFAGEFEGDRLAPFQTGADDAQSRLESLKQARTAAHVQEMADRLSASFPNELSVRHETISGATHLSVLPIAICRAVQIAFESAGDEPGSGLLPSALDAR